MSDAKQRQSIEATSLSQILASEARLNRLHRLFKTHYDVTEPSIILEPYLFLGNCISAHDTNHLSTLGIRYILNVAIRDVELCPYYSSDIRTLTIDLRDDDRENILRVFDQAFAFIDEAKRNQSRILVHCSHGQSRSPAIVIGYLMRTYNVSLEQCLTHVVKARACVLPNDGFLKQLILYDRFLVERRRRREEEAALKKIGNNTPTTEILIQQNPSVVPQSTTPIILTPPQYPVNKTSNEMSMSSDIQPSKSNIPIHVIPIQVSSKKARPEKIEPIPIKKIPVKDKPTVKEKKKTIKKLKENIPATDIAIAPSKSNFEVTSSSHIAPSKKRQSALITNIVKRPPFYTPRSHSANTGRTQVNHYSHYPFSPPSQKWNVTTYYPTNYHKFKEEKQTKYITEIYDKATNRFIPTKMLI